MAIEGDIPGQAESIPKTPEKTIPTLEETASHLARGTNDIRETITQAVLPEHASSILPLQKKAMETLSPFGTVRRSKEVPNADRTLFCIEQDHGTPSMLAEFLQRKSSKRISAWFAHQNALVDIQRELHGVAGDHCRFFLEAMKPDGRIFDGTPASYLAQRSVTRGNEPVCKEAAANPKKATQIAELLLSGPQDECKTRFLSLIGMQRYLGLLLCEQTASREQFIGLEYPGRELHENAIQTARAFGDVEGFKRERISDAIALNAFAGQQLSTSLREGDVGVLLLGAEHFFDQEEYAKINSKYADYNPEYPLHRLDKYLDESNALPSTNVFVFRPKSMPDRLSH